MEILANERFASGQADFFDAESKEQPRKTFNLLKRQHFLALNPRVLIERHAVRASKIASVCDRNSEIPHRAVKDILNGHAGIIALKTLVCRPN